MPAEVCPTVDPTFVESIVQALNSVWCIIIALF